MKRIIAILTTCLLALGATGAFAESVEEQIKRLEQELSALNSRVEKNERHTATDRISWYGDLRVKADSIDYDDVTFNPAAKVDFDKFFGDFMGGKLGGLNMLVMSDGSMDYNSTTTPSTPLDYLIQNIYMNNPSFFTGLQQAFKTMTSPGVAPIPLVAEDQKKTYGVHNDILYTTRLRLGMKATVSEDVNFSGRFSMYKNWGDSTGSKVFDSWNSFTMDGTDGGNTSGDFVRVERAYFDWKDIGGSNFYLSIGRRPSTYGPPSQYRENEMRGGTPTGHLVHFNFDGITVGYKLSELTGIEGQTVRFCYGQGFESQVGNGELFGEIVTRDTHLGGFNIDALNDGTNFLQLTYFQAKDVNDGFKGVIAFPTQYAAIFAPTMYQDLQKFPNFNFVTRVQPSTPIGDIDLAGIGFAREEMNGINWFSSFGWTHAKPNGKAGMFGGLMTDAVFEAQLNATGTEIMMVPVRGEDDSARDGYSVYAGVQVPAPMGKVGLEYNWGSKYWMPFTQAQDDMVGSKLAARGQVYEGYYVFDINPKMFIKLGGIYYDYEYTGSGSPVGEPVKIKDVEDGKEFSMMPVIDTAWDAYATMTVKF